MRFKKKKIIFKIEDGELEGGTWPRGGTPKGGHVSHATGMELFLRSIHVIASQFEKLDPLRNL